MGKYQRFAIKYKVKSFKLSHQRNQPNSKTETSSLQSLHNNGTNNLLVGLINGLKVPLISSHLQYEYLHLMVEGQNYHLPTLL